MVSAAAATPAVAAGSYVQSRQQPQRQQQSQLAAAEVDVKAVAAPIAATATAPQPSQRRASVDGHTPRLLRTFTGRDGEELHAAALRCDGEHLSMQVHRGAEHMRRHTRLGARAAIPAHDRNTGAGITPVSTSAMRVPLQQPALGTSTNERRGYKHADRLIATGSC